jgi:putative membrane protein
MGGKASRATFFRNRWHRALALGFGAWWLAMAIAPVHRFDWFLENLLIAAAVLLVWRLYPHLRISNAALTVMALFLSFHVLGSHYTYAEAPPGYWLEDAFHLHRNHYDRVIHFSFGLLMFWPLREISSQVIGAKGKWVDLIALLFIISMSALYEAIEWITALIVNSDAGDVFLGTQGDFFDAQKDHTMAITGGVLSFVTAKILKKLERLPKPV